MKKLLWLAGIALVLVACNISIGGTAPTGDTASDPASARTLLPDVPGYTRTDATNITDAITTAGGGVALISGNAAVAALIVQLDRMMQCYQGVGAVAAQVYTQSDISGVLVGQVPRVGAVAVVNQDRLSRNFLSCALGNQPQGFSAQADQLQPCGGAGSRVVRGETIHYVYGASAPDLCQAFQGHFDTLPQ
jgi:hypothetical protein